MPLPLLVLGGVGACGEGGHGPEGGIWRSGLVGGVYEVQTKASSGFQEDPCSSPCPVGEDARGAWTEKAGDSDGRRD